MIFDRMLLFSTYIQGYLTNEGVATNFSRPQKVRFHY
jgi:hypothetical protein